MKELLYIKRTVKIFTNHDILKLNLENIFYINRPLKFIENSPDRNKTAFNFKIEGQTRHREELLFSDISKLETSTFNSFKENKTVTFETLRKYDANIWSGKETLAPTTELKTFDAKDE